MPALLAVLFFSSCGIHRETTRVRGLSADERVEYSRRLGMPLSGKENPELIRELGDWVGTPYRYGGSTRGGADCSGFIWAVYRDVYGKGIPRTTGGMARESRRVRQGRLKEGDLVFFRMKGRKISHAGLYLGNRHFIHATTSRGVMVNSLEEDYYRRRFARGGRFL